MVRFKVWNWFVFASSSMFQFQSGAIQSARTAEKKRKWILSFNSKVVRFKAFSISCKLASFSSFNSKVVRFKVCNNIGLRWCVNRVSIPKWCDSKQWFRFCRNWRKDVSIPKWCDSKNNCPPFPQKVVWFQFQSGAIQRKIAVIFLIVELVFQFQSGAIQRIGVSYHLLQLIRVSIPKWCDSKNANSTIQNGCILFQFQSGAIQSML